MEPNEDTAVQDFLEILEEHRKNCERQGKYVEAEIAKNRLEELKLHEENRRRVSATITVENNKWTHRTVLHRTVVKIYIGGDEITTDR
jgi:hypothetical protein